MKIKFIIILVFQILLTSASFAGGPSTFADLILINGKIVTVDQNFTIAEAVAIKNDKILAVGSNTEIEKFANRFTEIIDLKGRTVIPGLTDAHAHPESASLSEIEEEIPDVHSIKEILNWIKSQTANKEQNEWIIFPKLFFTRLKELRQPSLNELDSMAPHHPVFLNGSYGGMINSAAMKVSGIRQDDTDPGLGRDSKTGQLNGFLRSSAFKLLKLPAKKKMSFQEKQAALQAMLKRYNQFGITSIYSGGGDYGSFDLYRDLNKKNKLSTRVFQNIYLNFQRGTTADKILDTLKTLKYITGYGDDMVRIGALKIGLDGGILTGTAFLREPWGQMASDIFGLSDTSYQGVLNYSREDVFNLVKAANELNWKFTAHCTGGGGVDLLLDVFEEVNRIKPIKERRFSIIHGNFFTPEAIRRMNELGIYADMQAAWFYKDADAMKYILGEKRIQTFHPYQSLLDAGVIVNGGSDHMVKWDANLSINPYNPFLAIWAMITRTTERGTIITPSEAISRKEALKMYTINNAYGSFEESLKGSIEKGKLADMAVITDDLLTCKTDQIKNIQSDLTLMGGKIVFSSGKLISKLKN